MQHYSRQQALKEFKQFLNTETGQKLINELATEWDRYQLRGEDTDETIYNIGLRDAYRFLKALQTGELIHERDGDD